MAEQALLAGRLRSSAGTTARSAAIIAAAKPDRPAIVETRASDPGGRAEAAVAWEDRAVAAAAADWAAEVVEVAAEVAQVAAEVAEEVEADE